MIAKAIVRALRVPVLDYSPDRPERQSLLNKCAAATMLILLLGFLYLLMRGTLANDAYERRMEIWDAMPDSTSIIMKQLDSIQRSIDDLKRH